MTDKTVIVNIRNNGSVKEQIYVSPGERQVLEGIRSFPNLDLTVKVRDKRIISLDITEKRVKIE